MSSAAALSFQGLTPDLGAGTLEAPTTTVSLIGPLLLRPWESQERKLAKEQVWSFPSVPQILPDYLFAPGTQRQDAHPVGRETTCMSGRHWDLNLVLEEDGESFDEHMGFPGTVGKCVPGKMG